MVVFVSMFVANAILTELRDRGIITTPVLVLAMVFLLGGFAVYWRFCWVPRASSSEPDRPRITVAETWHSPYPPPTKASGPCPWQPPSRQRPGTETPGSVARSGTTSGGTPAHPQQFIEDEVRTRGAALLRRARSATS